MNDRGYTNSVPWMYAVTLTPYHEWPGSHQLRTMNWSEWKWLDGVDKLTAFMVRSWCDPGHSWYRVSVTAYIHGTELMWPRSFMVRSWCDREHSWYGVGVIPQSHSMWFLCTVHCTVEIHLADFFLLSSMTSAAINLLCVSVTIRINRVFHSQHFFQQINNFWKYNVKKSTKFHT